MNLRNFKSSSDRRRALEAETGVNLASIGKLPVSDYHDGAGNCENMIGLTGLPLGVAGPLAVKQVGGLSVVNHYIPLATTEGALVASVSRGCKAVTESGGAIVKVVRSGTTRGPVFKVKDLAQSERLRNFLSDNNDDLRMVAEKTSSHLKYLGFETGSAGRYLFVRFSFDTQDAMGLNMITIATDAAVRYIEEKTGIPCIDLSGNFCVDKKPSWANFTRTRGFAAWAEVIIPESVIGSTLKTNPQKLYESWLAKCMIGSAMTGSLGFNAQYANVISAVFIATGQDPAHVTEGSMGITTVEIPGPESGSGAYVSVYLPDLMVGTVGGGTGLPTQKEALSLMGVAGGASGNNASGFAGIIAAAVLAGEISLLSSLSVGTLAQAHRHLGRPDKNHGGRP